MKRTWKNIIVLTTLTTLFVFGCSSKNDRSTEDLENAFSYALEFLGEKSVADSAAIAYFKAKENTLRQSNPQTWEEWKSILSSAQELLDLKNDFRDTEIMLENYERRVKETDDYYFEYVKHLKQYSGDPFFKKVLDEGLSSAISQSRYAVQKRDELKTKLLLMKRDELVLQTD